MTKRKPKEDHLKIGRPTLYSPKLCQDASRLCKLGATDLEMADFFGVEVMTIYRWKNTYPDFCYAIARSKEEADESVEVSLYRRATGYTHKAVKIFMPAGAEKPVYAHYQEHVPPDSTAAFNWLKNRRPHLWREQHDISATVLVAQLPDLEIAQRIANLLIGAEEEADALPTPTNSAKT